MVLKNNPNLSTFTKKSPFSDNDKFNTKDIGFQFAFGAISKGRKENISLDDPNQVKWKIIA
jgi:hypothetical protein